MPGYAYTAARPSVGEKNSDGEPPLGAVDNRPVAQSCPGAVDVVVTRCVACACAGVMPSFSAPKPSGPSTVADTFGAVVVTGGTNVAGNDGTGPTEAGGPASCGVPVLGFGVTAGVCPVGSGRAVGVPAECDVHAATAPASVATTTTATKRTDDIAPPNANAAGARSARQQDRSRAALGA
jgi:hypothetical protein